ncbi:MAG: helix-turn-helix domain-containing protein, partial [Coriobacteriales bacterium]|nr:helix-turn-helix domain-containing protein [Coriobacteriales bacterium]
DMVYLTQPDVIQLFRYDSKYNDNLLDVLYYYCLNDLNIVKTAKAIFMHRNTVAAKLKKIDQLIFEDYTNGEVQQRIIISYKILRYMNLYIQIDLSKHIPTLDYV